MRHKLVDILVIVLAGIMCGCEQWIKIEDFARNKESWLREDGVTLGQLRTQEKSNEITAIPDLLESLDIRGASVTIDAMGCQTEIARKIVDLKANYVLAVKRNQPSPAAGCPVF